VKLQAQLRRVRWWATLALMCGRFVQIKRRRDYEEYMRMLASRDRKLEEHPSWNIPPSKTVWTVRQAGGELGIDRLTWGWPAGAEGRLVSNARVESAQEKPLFRDAWRTRRCLVPVEGWYEWQALGPKSKQPYFFAPRSGEPALPAGLWTEDAFVLLTAATHAALAAIHTRRPVALSLDQARRWCDTAAVWTRDELERAMTSEDQFDIVPVSAAVNGTRQDGPELVQRITDAQVARRDLLLPGF
jgi:putative SOS response-associated peptidase YedK